MEQPDGSVDTHLEDIKESVGRWRFRLPGRSEASLDPCLLKGFLTNLTPLSSVPSQVLELQEALERSRRVGVSVVLLSRPSDGEKI